MNTVTKIGAAAVIAIVLAGCAGSPAEPVDDGVQVEVPSGEVDPADDPMEAHFERREALLERQSREVDELEREFDVGEYNTADPWEEAEKCRAEAMTYDAQDACDLIDERAARNIEEYERRRDELTERHDEEEDALEREFEELGGVNVDGP